MNSTGKCEQGRGMSEKGHLFISRGQPLVHIADGKGRRPKTKGKAIYCLITILKALISY